MTGSAANKLAWYGPWLVGLGAALWGTESAWRIPLNDLLGQPDVLVFWEHVILAACALPFVIPRLGELRTVKAKTIAWLVFSGVAGSAVGAVLFTLALKHGNATVVNVVLNIQPVLSTTGACMLLGDRLARGFWMWALLAVVAGMWLVGLGPGMDFAVDAGIGYALACAIAWGLSTVAGRAVMAEMSLPLAAGLRVIIGLLCMTVIVAARGLLNGADLWPVTAAAQSGKTILWLCLLATLSGGVPLVIYFRGLALTRASTAGYFEMLQTLAAVIVTWGFFGDAMKLVQVLAALVLIVAVAMVQRAQRTVE
jgi:drug/metabolite transporter (DMT)-like permease